MEVKTTQTYQVCRTGKLNQYYTLYVWQIIKGENFYHESYYFRQNLSIELDKAIETAQKLMPIDANCELEVMGSPKKEYCNLQAYGMEWRKTPKGFCANPTPQFWDVWRQNKANLKSIGFSVFKPEDQGFIVFFRNTTNEEMIESFSELEQMKVTITGNHLGSIKERLRSLQVSIIYANRCEGDYGDYSVYTFETSEGHKLKTYYSGKNRYEVGQQLVLSATVKDHVISGGEKTTIITRMKVQHVVA